MSGNPGRDPVFRMMAAAEKAMVRGRHARAAALYSQLIAGAGAGHPAKDKLATCHLNRGFCLRALKRQGDALNDYARSSQLNPLSFKPHLNAALIHAQDFERYPQAVVEFDKALALHPTCTEALSSRGLTKMLMADLQGARDDLEAALSIEPDDPDTLCNLGNLYAQEGQLDKAASTYKRALQTNPRDAEIRCNLALALMRMGAQNAADAVLREDRKAVRLWRQKGRPLTPGRAGCLLNSLILLLVTLLAAFSAITVLS